MKHLILIVFTVLLAACSDPRFVADAPAVPKTSNTPKHFDLPARFAYVRTVYGAQSAAGAKESALWADLATRTEDLGSFSPLVSATPLHAYGNRANMFETARAQRFRYLILVQMDPSNGSANIVLHHVGSGGVMATAQAVSPAGGKNGFWGRRINNRARLARTTLPIAKVAIPVVEELLRGAALRQR